MIQVFFNKRGSGKTKKLMNLANEKAMDCSGNSVYIDDDKRLILQLHRNIRFISTEDFSLMDYHGFYGFLCGIIAQDYDIENIYIDGLSNIVSGCMDEAAHLFSRLEDIQKTRSINVYISINSEELQLPEFIKKYVA
ncbi:hypothetical protein SAMN02745163_03284 [Clostridium cavendishii DSM 21758]|uniref:Twitching motility protein PilT n=1 Tax=Clostridium cavendishii DSM 21758 TaxID=1121302 RepID=A0A1M6Q4P6_9CLOT|nr:hypothetical protein [Clostridium cavendishii]SHK15083.1 hypothetical protein SAMN02745163_03284 [Clostridium cavendishii DSM 21758]